MTTETRDKGLRSIVEQAVELSRLFRVQQAQFKVHMPTVDNDHPLIFDAETMEDTTGEDDHALSRQHVECVMFPCVMKFGDETGDNVSYLCALTGVPVSMISLAGTASECHSKGKGVLSRTVVETHHRLLSLDENSRAISITHLHRFPLSLCTMLPPSVEGDILHHPSSPLGRCFFSLAKPLLHLDLRLFHLVICQAYLWILTQTPKYRLDLILQLLRICMVRFSLNEYICNHVIDGG